MFMERKKIRNDIILAVCVLAASLIALAVFLCMRARGSYAVVLIDGKETARYSLSENAEIEIKSENGVNILKIENGKASVISASCPDGICTAHRAVRYGGEVIVCLPNKLVIRIDSANDSGVDAVS